MKKLILILFILIPLHCFSQMPVVTNYYADGFWGEWKNKFLVLSVIRNGGFTLHEEYDHPSEWMVKVIYSPDNNKDRIKARYKNKEWEKIPCKIIFRATHTDLKELMKLNLSWAQKTCIKEIAYDGEIWIAPYKYKKGMRVFNIFVEGYGLGISITRGSIIWLK